MGVLAAVMGLVVLLQLVAGVWLGVQGQWAVIGYGLFLLFIGAVLLHVALYPGRKLVELAELRGSRAMVFGAMLVATLWGSLCMAFWCELSAQRYLPLAVAGAATPILIWGNGVALLPLNALAVAHRGFWVTVVQVVACMPLYAVSVAAAQGHLGDAVHMAAQVVAVLAAPIAVSLVLLREASAK